MSPATGEPSSRTGLLSAVVFAAALAAYLPGLAPGLTGEDSGDFLVAARVFGIPHPPGYPLWCLLAGGLSRLLPVEPFARAVNATSALLGAAAAASCVPLARRLGCGALASLCVGLLFAFSRSLWGGSVVAEVYSLHALLSILLLLATHRAATAPSVRSAAVLGLAAGLSLAHHPLMRGLVPIAGLATLGTRALRGWRRALAASAGLACGLSVLLYLPLRAAAGPEKNWGDPRTLPAFLDHVLLSQYQPPATEGIAWPTVGLVPRLGALGATLLREFSAPSLPLLAGGLAVLLLASRGAFDLSRRDPRSGGLLLATALASTVGIAIYSAGRDARFYPPDYETFSLPAFGVLAVLAGVGLESLRRLARPAVPALLALGLPALAFASNLAPNDRSGSTFAGEYGRAILETVEPDGVLIGYGGGLAFPCEYLQIVEGVRRDVRLAVRTGRIDRDLLEPFSAEEAAHRKGKVGGALRDFEEDLLVRRLLGRRPIYLSRERPPAVPGVSIVRVGLLHRVVRAGTAEEQEARARDGRLWAGYRFESLGHDRGDRTVVEAEIHVRIARARHLLDRGEAAAAIGEFLAADDLRPLVPAERANLGVAFLRAGRPGEAEGAFRRAVLEDPSAFAARANLGHLLAATGRPAEAVEALRPILARAEADAGDHQVFAAALEAAGAGDQAMDAIRSALLRFPGDSLLLLGQARLLAGRGECAGARALADRVSPVPDDPRARSLLEEIRARCP